MKLRIVGNWTLIRMIRLLVGSVGTVQGFIVQEFELSLLAFLLVYMAIADKHSTDQYEVELQETSQNSNQTDHEKVDRLL